MVAAMDRHGTGIWQRVKGFRIPDWLLRLASFVASTAVAAGFFFGAIVGLQEAIMKLTVDAFYEPGVMARYDTVPFGGSVADFQRHWNMIDIVAFTVLRETFVAVLIALGSHELWLRRVNDQAREQGKPLLKKAYRPSFARCHTRRASFWQAVRTAALALSVLLPTFLAVFGAWIVEDKIPRAGLSFPLAALNTTLYYGNVVPRSSVHLDPANFTCPEKLVDAVPLLQDQGLIHAANPPMSYYALYPKDMLDIPEEMRNTAYYLPRSSFPLLEAHLARSSRKQVGITEPPAPAGANLTTVGIPFGDAIYPDVHTLGIGINMTSYEVFLGDGMAGLPRNYMFAGMTGRVYGNAVKVQCLDTTDEYELSSREYVLEGQLPSINYTFIKKRPRFPDQEKVADFTVSSTSTSGPLIFSHLGLSGKEPLPLSYGLHHEYGTLQIGEQAPPFIFNNAPLHTVFILPDGKQATSSAGVDQGISHIALKCIYLPSEFGTEFFVLSEQGRKGVTPKAETITTAGPLAFRDPQLGFNAKGEFIGPHGKRMQPPPAPRCVDPIYAIPAARAVHELLTNPDYALDDSPGRSANYTAGGVLREVLAEYYSQHPPTRGFGRRQARNARFLRESVIEPVFSATSSAYFSLLRQRVEAANIWIPQDAVPRVSPEDREVKKRNGIAWGGSASGPSFWGTRDIIGLDDFVTDGVLVGGIIFWVLRMGGAAPYGLHWVGLCVLLWIGIRATKAAWRTFMFGRGERRWGRWWEESAKVECDSDNKRSKAEGNSVNSDEEQEKKLRGKANEELLGRDSDMDGKEAAQSDAGL